MNVGYVGLGAMGRALAGHLIGKFPLTVWDLNPAALEDFVARGASTAASLDALARECDIVILCLPRSSDVETVLFGPGGLAAALSPGAIVIDQTSGIPGESAGFAAKLEAVGISLIDCPVAGGVPSAISGGITIMASGPDQAYQRSLPVLRTMTQKVYKCSDRVGDGQAMKLVNNMINAAYRMATLEIAAAGRSLGLSLDAITQALNTGPAQNFITLKLLGAILEGRAATDFALALMVKDLNQAVALAESYGAPMPVSNVARGLIQMALNKLGPTARLDDVVPFMEAGSNIKFVGLPGEAPRSASIAEHDMLVLVVDALTACNRLITYENAALGVKIGLGLNAMATVLNNGSGWSVQSERILPALVSGSPTTDNTLGDVVASLGRLSNLAAAHGVPMLVANQARCIVEGYANEVGADRPLDSIVARYEQAAAVKFRANEAVTRSAN